MVAVAKDNRSAQALVALLRDLTESHQGLLAAIEQKIEAMRSADVAAMTEAMRTEQRLLAHIEEREGLRRQLAEKIARGYGISRESARKLSAAQLAARIGDPEGARIMASAARLKDVTTKIAGRNHVAQRISQSVLKHMKHVFAAMTGQATGGGGYGGDGFVRTANGERILDAVG